MGTAKDIIGWNQGRVLLVTYRAIHIAGRHFWRWRFGVLLACCTVPIRYVTRRPGSGEETFHVNWSGFQVGSDAKTTLDIDLFVEAGVNG